MRVLVTGGAGYIGSHTAKALAGHGFEPVVYDNLSEGNRWAVRWGPLVEGDLADSDLLQQAIEDYQIEAVIHFAAHAYVGESMRDPRKYLRNNVVNSLNLLDAMMDTGVRHIVFSSTCATYGVPDDVPIPEHERQRPVNPYGESKRMVERSLHWYGECYDLTSVALRYFNAAGCDPEGEIGELHDPETHLIPIVLEAAAGERAEVSIYGTDYPTPDGTAVRDFIHVSDLAHAHVRALHYLLDGGDSCALNLGTGLGHSVREVIREAQRVTGRAIATRDEPRRPGDPAALVADASRASQILDWTPRLSDLPVIIDTAWQWQQAISQPGAVKSA